MEELLQTLTNLLEAPDGTDHYPPPSPPVGRKSDIFDEAEFLEIDRRAKESPGRLVLSYTDMLTYLTKDMTTDLQKLRSVFVWMGTRQLIDGSKYAEDLPAVTPYWFLQLCANGHGCDDEVMTSFFALLCRLAGLPCVVVKGYDKQMGSYVVGDKFKTVNSRWNAVYVDGSWRLVDPVGAFTGVIGGSAASDWVLLEDSGQAVRERYDYVRPGVPVQLLNESYFLTDPDVFVYFCFPEDPAWQLLPEPWTLQKFVKTPKFTRFYLRSDWQLSDKHEAIVPAPGGKCCIQMDKVPDGEAAIGYKLFFNEKKSKGKIPDKLQLDSYIFRTGTTKQQSVMTRLPVNGVYKLQIMDTDKATLCELRIDCTGKIEGQKRFPETPEKGFGFSQEAIDAGLVDPSREEGVVVAHEGEKVRFRFRTTKPLKVRARLVHSVLPSQQLNDRVSQEQEDDVVIVTVRVPWEEQNPEFSLQLDAREQNSEAEFVNVLNYLLTPDKQLLYTIKGLQQQLREELAAATADDDVHRLESALREFRAAHVQDKDELNKAYTRLYHLHRDAIGSSRNNEEKLTAALKDTNTSQVGYLLRQSDWFQQAQDTLRRMRRLAGVKHEVQNLGGRQKWEYVQSLLRRQGRQGILQRIQNRDVSAIDPKLVQQACLHLNTCSAEEIRCLSIGAAAFYEWSKAAVELAKKDDVSCIQPEREEDAAEETRDAAEETPDNKAETGTGEVLEE